MLRKSPIDLEVVAFERLLEATAQYDLEDVAAAGSA